VFRTHVVHSGIDAPTLATHTRIMADGIMRELRARSPSLSALPATRRERRLLIRHRLRR
jgi:hypothetical protein